MADRAITGFRRTCFFLRLQSFTADEERELRSIIEAISTPEMSWIVIDDGQADAILLTKGTRDGDPDHSAVLRVRQSVKPLTVTDDERRKEPLLIRKPIRAVTLKVALNAAAARIVAAGEDL